MKRFNEIEAEAYKREFMLPFAGRNLNYMMAIAEILAVSDAFGFTEERGVDLISIRYLIKLVELSN